MIKDYEQGLLIAGEAMYQDLVKSGTDQSVLEDIENDLEARRVRIAQLEAAGKLPQPPKYYPEIPLPDEMERQRIEATERIAVPLGIDRVKFQAQLPSRFPERPVEYNELHLTVPLLIPDLTPFGVTWLQMTEAINFYDPADPETPLKAYIWDELRNRINKGELKIWKDPRSRIESFPQAPHTVWVQDGTRYKHEEPRKVRKALHLLERAGDHFKGTGLATFRPDMYKSMFWDFIGGQLGSGLLPYGYWDDVPRFDYYWDAHALPDFRALVCGSKFTVA